MKKLFISSCKKLGANGNLESFFEKIAEQYAQPKRYYHTFDGHIAFCLSELQTVSRNLNHLDEITIALLLHDVIMDFHATDNEQRSADFAADICREININKISATIIANLILATKHDCIPTSQKEKYMIDIDLSILGKSERIFDEYEADIRKEYAFVPESEFRLRRSAILQHFLKRPSIFQTKSFIDRYEKTARENLCRSIKKLR